MLQAVRSAARFPLHIRAFFCGRAPLTLGRLALPPEIILIIATYLPKVSLLSFSLTCRTFHNLCFPESPNLNPTETQELLLLIEKDVAHLYFCHICVKLHRWTTCWLKYVFLGGKESLSYEGRCQFQLSICSPITCCIPYHRARLAMNRHLYGTAHGIPSSDVVSQYPDTDAWLGVKFRATWHARIVDDQLLVSSVITISSPSGNGHVTRKYVDQNRHYICPHLFTHISGERGPIMRLPELAKNCSGPNYFEPCGQSVRSCLACRTDYCIDIFWGGRKKGWAINLTTYRQLGACRSPWDWDWRIMTGLSSYSDRRALNPVKYRPGIVRQMWNKFDHAMPDSNGEWVGNPELALSI